MKNLKYILLFFLFCVISFNNNNFLEIKDKLSSNIVNSVITVKVTEDKIHIQDKYIDIKTKIPSIHYNNKEIQRYINTYIRKEINDYKNTKRQFSKINKSKEYIDINYHIPFKNNKIINIVITKEIKNNKDYMEIYKESYIFDLESGQRIYLGDFLKNNNFKSIESYISNYIKSNNLNIDYENIKINNETNFTISDGGIIIFFNPYKISHKDFNEFKIPFEVFKEEVKLSNKKRIIANIDTQVITKETYNASSVINIPMISIDDKEFEKEINRKITNDIMNFYKESQKEIDLYNRDIIFGVSKLVMNANFKINKNDSDLLELKVIYDNYLDELKINSTEIYYKISIKNKKIIVVN